MNWHYTSLSDDYPQKPDICLVETSYSYKLLWYNKRRTEYDKETHTYTTEILREIWV